MKKLIPFIVLFVSVQTGLCQSWTELMHQKNGNLYNIQQAFNNYWDVNDKTAKSRGYKVFKRWEYMVAPRVYPSGELSQLSNNAANFQAFMTSNSNINMKAIGPSATLASTTWSLVGPLGAMTGTAVNGLPRKAGRDNFITFHPTTSGTFWAGAPVGGLWKTTNNGTSWTTTTDLLNVIGCTDLAVDPTNTNTLYLATGDGDAGDCPSIGVLKSTNGGTSWSTTGLTFSPSNNLLIHRLLINPSNTQILLAATNGGIYRTTNGGTSWSQINNINTYDMEFKPGDPNTVYASGAYFYLSTNAGVTFTQVTSGIATTGSNRMAIAVTSHTAGLNYVYVIASNSTNSGLLGIYRSTNSGVTFSTMATSPDVLVNSCAATGSGGQGWYDLAIAASPLNANEVVVGGVNHWRSLDGCATWSIIGCWNSTVANPPYVHADVHDLEYSPTGVLYSANDGGVYQYTGSAWTDISGTRNIAQIYRIGLSSLSTNYWITGHQDNGSNIYNGTTYAASYPGDGLDCFIDKANNSNLFTETPNGGLVKSTNGGASWLSASSGITGSSNWLCPWKQSTGPANVIYAGFNAIWTSTNQGTSWTSLAPFSSTAGSVVEFAIAPTNSLVMYALKSSAVYYTSNGGTSWSAVTGTIPVGSAALTYVAVDASNPSTAWVTLSGYSAANKVYMTTNAGTTWTNITSNLPNLPANCIVNEPGTNGRVYVGMDVGVYYRDNASPTWTLYNAGLPNTQISDLKISPAAPGKLRAATYGRGVYEVDVVPCSNGPTVNVVASSQTICAGSTVTLSASGASLFAWSTGTTGVSITVSPTLTSAYSVTGTTSGCTDVKTITITVVSPPSLSANASNSSVCTGVTSTLTASGATSYTWTGFTANTNPIVVSPTVPTVYTVTGSNGTCSSTKTITVLIAPPATFSASANQTVCTGACATLQATGVSGYTWTPGSLTGSSVVMCPTVTTSYTVTGSNGFCTANQTVNITVNAATPLSLTASTSSFCVGNSATLTASGYASYLWSTGSTATSIVVSPTSTAVYSVTGTNGSCISSASKTINVIAYPVLTVTTQSACAGGNATITASGALTYTWNTGATTSSIVASTSVANTYTVVGSNQGCNTAQTAFVPIVANPSVTVNSLTLCAGNPGTLIASGATSYTWSTGSTAGSIVISPSLTTTYSVIGSNGSCTASAQQTVTVTPGPSLTVNNQTICPGGSATLIASGATNYTWSNGPTGSVTVVSPTVNTTYTVLGANGSCSNTKTVSVTLGGNLSISINTLSLCAGSPGTLSASGATSYTWSTGANSPTIAINPSITTTYSVTGSNGTCSGTNAVIVTVNPNPTVSASNQTICSGGTATLTASGASTYSWNTGATSPVITVSPGITTVYTVTGFNGSCSNTKTVSVVVGSSMSVALSPVTSTICAGGSTTLTASGASSYNWSNGPTGSSIVVSPSVNTAYSVIGSVGTCTAIASGTVVVVPLPNITVNNATICPGGTATLIASGATSYTWNNNLPFAINIVSPSVTTVYTVVGIATASTMACSNSATATVTIGSSLSVFLNSSAASVCSGGPATITASGAGSYTWSTGSNATSIVVNPTVSSSYSVIGQSGTCTGTAVTNVAVVQSPILSLASSASGSVCAGASATLSATGASTYSWSTGGTGNSIVVSPTVNTIYTVTGSIGGCSVSNTILVAVGAGSLNLNVIANPASICSGGTTTISASGAGSYTWSTGSNQAAIVVSPGSTTTYSVTGASGSCSGNAALTVSVGVAAPIGISALPSASLCLGKTATLTASGSYITYVWSSPSFTGSSIVVTPSANTVYTVTGSGGSSGCTNSATVSISIAANPVSVLTSTNTGCSTSCSGMVNATTTGGTSPYSYSLSTGSCTSMPCTNLCPGLYTLYTMDSNGCSTFNIFSINSSPNALNTAFNTSNATCGSCANGVLTASASGGTAPYTYSWSPTGGNSATAFSLTPGCYTVTVLDSRGCMLKSSACVGITTGLSQTAVNEADLLVYPNPAHDKVTVQYNGASFSTALYNGLGQVLVFNNQAVNSTELNTSLLAKGVYFLEVKFDNTIVRRKVIIE